MPSTDVRLFVISLLFCWIFPGSAHSQTLNARVRITSLAPARIKIEAEFPEACDALSFHNTYAGIIGLGERIEKVEGFSASGDSIPVRRLAPGEFRSKIKARRFAYDVKLDPPSHTSDMSHVSWLQDENGVLMMADLLPQAGVGGFAHALIHFEVPAGWHVVSAVPEDKEHRFSSNEPEKAVFLVTPAVQAKTVRVGSTDFTVAASGKWSFAAGDVMKLAGKLLKDYRRLTESQLRDRAVLMILPFPGEVGAERWTGETRGQTVVLLIGRRATRQQLVGRMGVVLSHELLHLWVPNSLDFKGDYDWFFEGFTLYQALRADQRLGFIRFDEFLETLARVYDSYLSVADRDRLSVTEASKQRWTTSSSLVYDKGMLLAFIYDLTLRNRSNNQVSLDDLYRKLFRMNPAGSRDANEVIISLMEGSDISGDFAKTYISRPASIDLGILLKPFGIKVEQKNSHSRLIVVEGLSDGQLKVLRSLGYKS